MRTSWIGILAVIALLAGVGVWITQTRPAAQTAPPPPITDDLAMPADSESIVEKALAQIPVDSTELKNRWMDEVKNIDVAGLTPKQRERFVQVANSRRCTCGCGFTLATCRVFDPTCPVSGPYLEELRDSVAAGRIPATGLRTAPRPG
jgi:hypothetical protein